MDTYIWGATTGLGYTNCMHGNPQGFVLTNMRNGEEEWTLVPDVHVRCVKATFCG